MSIKSNSKLSNKIKINSEQNQTKKTIKKATEVEVKKVAKNAKPVKANFKIKSQKGDTLKTVETVEIEDIKAKIRKKIKNNNIGSDVILEEFANVL